MDSYNEEIVIEIADSDDADVFLSDRLAMLNASIDATDPRGWQVDGEPWPQTGKEWIATIVAYPLIVLCEVSERFGYWQFAARIESLVGKTTGI